MNLDLLKQELIRDEGVRLKPYTDTVGKTSIGVGRNLDDVGISRAEAMAMLDSDIWRTATTMDSAIPGWRDLDDTRQRVLLNMAFNMGVSGLLGFRGMLSAVRAGDYTKAAEEMLDSLWARQVGDRSKRLAKMMATGGA